MERLAAGAAGGTVGRGAHVAVVHVGVRPVLRLCRGQDGQ